MRTNIKTIIMANIARQASPQGTWPTDILTKLRFLAFVYYDFGLVFEDLFSRSLSFLENFLSLTMSNLN